MLTLKEINLEDAKKEYAFFQAFPSENGFENYYYGMTYDAFVGEAIPAAINSAKGIVRREGYVPDTSYLLWDNDTIVGVFRVRHYLNESLAGGAGHIGYAIAPAYRGKGYATKGLALALNALRAMPDFVEDEIYLRCYRSNLPSLRAMLANGGYIHSQDGEHCNVRIPR